jgi:tetratricopeptide (TPR) repeat protein
MSGMEPDENRDSGPVENALAGDSTVELSGNDRIHVGNIQDSAAIAVGRGAKAQVSVFNIDVRLLPLVLALVAGVIGLAAVIFNLTKNPETMLGEFNVAVAEFAVVDENGRRIKSDDGRNVANWLHRRLAGELSALGITNYELWPPEYTKDIAGNSAEERSRSAEDLADAINANVIVSGVITQTQRPQMSLEFTINNRGFRNADELTGPHYLGNPLLISLPFNPDQFQGINNPALSARANALSQIAIGLSYYAIDDFEGAIEYFKRAEATEGWLSNAGKEVAYLLLGNAYARWASKDKDIAHLDEANLYLDKAQAIKDPYARAAVSRASVLYLQALGDPVSSTVDMDLLNEAEARFEEALLLEDAPPEANVESKVYFGLGQIDLVRFGVEGGDWLEEARSDFDRVIGEYEAGNERIQDLAAHAYARLGLIERLSGNEADALPFYEKSAELASPFYQVQYLAQVGDLYATLCQPEMAIEIYDRAIQIAEANGDAAGAENVLTRRNALNSHVCP